MTARIDLLPVVLRRTPAALPVIGAATLLTCALVFAVLAILGGWPAALPMVLGMTAWPAVGALVAVAVDLCAGADPTLRRWAIDLVRGWPRRAGWALAWSVPATFLIMNNLIMVAGPGAADLLFLSGLAALVLTLLGAGWAVTALVVDAVPGLGWRSAAAMAVRKIPVLIGVAVLGGIGWWLATHLSVGLGLLLVPVMALALASGVLTGHLVPVDPAPEDPWALPADDLIPSSSRRTGVHHG
ncbi:hypothetical protein ACQBAR_13925 [Propionibacteriaceae bacterium Y1685]